MLFNRELEYRCGLSKSMDSFGPIENISVSQDPILTDVDKNSSDSDNSSYNNVILKIWKNIAEKATGGGAYKYADLFRERLGISLKKEDEMDCLVAGANFLLKVNILEPYANSFI